MEDDKRRQSLPMGEIRKIAEFAMDRTVAPMKTAAVSTQPPTAVTINFGTSLRSHDDTTRASAARFEPEPETIDGALTPIPSAATEGSQARPGAAWPKPVPRTEEDNSHD
jgi:hypothetical protein